MLDYFLNYGRGKRNLMVGFYKAKLIPSKVDRASYYDRCGFPGVIMHYGKKFFQDTKIEIGLH